MYQDGNRARSDHHLVFVTNLFFYLGPSLHPWRAHESQTAENGDQVQTEAGELCRQKFIIYDEFSFSSSSLQSPYHLSSDL